MTMRKFLSWLGTLLMVTLFGAWCVLLRPVALGGPATYIIVTGHSMEPTFFTGDLVIVHAQGSYSWGQVIAYRAPNGGLIIHRIVGGDGTHGFLMKGDNDHFYDPWRPTYSQVVGAQWLYIKQGGAVLATIRTPRYISTIVSVMAVLTLLGGSEVQRRRRRRKGANSVTQTKRKTLTEQMPAPLWMILAGSVMAVLTLAGLTGFIIAARQPSQQSRMLTQATYTDTATYSYTVRLRPSLLYPTGTLGPVAPSPSGAQVSEPPIPTRLVNTIDLALAYQFQGDPSATGDLSADLVIQADSSWSKTLPLLSDTPFSGGKATANMTLNMVQITSIINAISQQTGIDPASYQLLVTPTIHVHGVVGGNALTETYTPTYTLQMDMQQITMGQNLAQSETHTISTTVVEFGSVNWLGVRLALAQARLLSALALLLGVLGLVVLGTIYAVILARDESLRIRVRYGSLLVTVAEVRRDASTRMVKLASIRDLERLAKRGEGVIFWQRVSPTNHLYFVEDDRAVYAYPIGDVSEMMLDSSRTLSFPDPLWPPVVGDAQLGGSGFPASVVEAEHDLLGRTRADFPREGSELHLEELDRDGRHQVEDGAAGGKMDEADEVAPVIPMLDRREGTLPVETPNLVEDRLQADLALVARPELDLRLGEGGRDRAEEQAALFLQTVCSAGLGCTWCGHGVRCLPSSRTR